MSIYEPDKCHCTNIRICEYCRRTLEKGNFYCLHCGAKLYHNVPSKTNDPHKGQICPECGWKLPDYLN